MTETTTGISPEQRFSRSRPCPICNGHPNSPQGQGSRCYGFLSADGNFAQCTREEHAGTLEQHPESDTFAHRLEGSCGCGVSHGPGTVVSLPKHKKRWKGDKPQGRVVATYDYTDEKDNFRHQTVRYEPKDFKQRRPDGNGSWVWSLQGVDTVLYHLPEVLEARERGETIYLVEGEKDADNAREHLGIVATTAPMGAGKWKAAYTETLRGAHVVIIGDNDSDGRNHVESVAASVASVAESVRVVELPGLAPGGDISDWIGSGGTREQLHELVKAAETKTDPVKALLGKRLSDYQPERVSFLWEGRIPRGKITIIDGDPGDGKSVLTTYIAACVSTGRRFPDGASCEMGGVVMLNAEDGLSDTIRPRIDAAGGDATKVLPLAFLPDENGAERPFAIPDDLPLLERAIEAVGASLVVVDPLMAFLPEKVSAHKDQDVRRALAPLSALAERTGAAILVIRHLNKAAGTNPLYRGGGSIGIIGAARSSLIVARDPEDEDVRIFAPLKQNLSRPAESLKYVIRTAANGAAAIEWQGVTPFAAKDLLKPQTNDEDRSALAEAKQFLKDELEDSPMHARQVLKDMREAGISEPTLRRAKAALKVRSERESDGSWTWALPKEGAASPQGGQAQNGEHLDSLDKVVKDEHLDSLEKTSIQYTENFPYISVDGQGYQGYQGNRTGGDGRLGSDGWWSEEF